MERISVLIVLVVGVWTASFFLGVSGAKADDQPMTNNEAQVLNDEGYGNEDAEYYNSEYPTANAEETSAPSRYATGSMGSDAQ